jgi:hypothetical protein
VFGQNVFVKTERPKVTTLKVAMQWKSAFKFFDEYPVENHWSKQLIYRNKTESYDKADHGKEEHSDDSENNIDSKQHWPQPWEALQGLSALLDYFGEHVLS